MKTVKRLCSLLFVLTLLGALTVPAYADVLWGPADAAYEALIVVVVIAVFAVTALLIKLLGKKKK